MQIFKAEGGLDFEELNTEVDFDPPNEQKKQGDDKSEASFAEGGSPQ